MATPQCKYFNKCGGCTAQHIDYAIQLENKKKQLFQVTHFPEIQVFSDKEYGYRTRMDFKVFEGGIGLRLKDVRSGSIDIIECSISNDELNILLLEVRSYFKEIDAFSYKKKNGTYKYIVIRTPPGDSCISFVLNEDSSKLTREVERIRQFANVSTAKNVVIAYVKREQDLSTSDEFFAVKGNEYIHESFLGKDFVYSAQGFFQNNHLMAEKMQDYVHSLLKKHETKDKHLLDLYGGVGTFGLMNAGLFKTVTIVEGVESAIEMAYHNIQNLGITNAQAKVKDAAQLKTLEIETPLFVITDPPRSGMHPKTIEGIKELFPEVIIYISYNLEQLAKELPKFQNYEVKSAAIFDLFPQTNHAEAIVELGFKKGSTSKQS